jgi:hypothetical protein
LPFHPHALIAQFRRRDGFSVLEAIIVLAITGMALTLIFSIGSRASDVGFRLGRRALSVADSQVATDSFHSLVNGIWIPPFEMPADANTGGDLSFQGNATTLSGVLVSSRATPCAGPGPSGRITLTIGKAAGHVALLCVVGDHPPIMIADLGLQPAQFSYSENGSAFVDHWSVQPGQPANQLANPNSPIRDVVVRLSNADGSVQTLAVATSGRPIPWSVFDPRVVN